MYIYTDGEREGEEYIIYIQREIERQKEPLPGGDA
jgi:hypothetical protein